MKFKSLAIGAMAVALAAGQAAAASAQDVQGKVVDYLSYLHVNQGGVLVNSPNSGGITVNASNAGIYTHGSTEAAHPLGLLANGTLYLLDIPKNKGNDAKKLAGDLGKGTITVKGQVVQRDGTSILVVSGVKT